MKAERLQEAYVDWYGKGRQQAWRTPQDLFDKLNERYLFDLDGAADETNSLCKQGSTAAAPIPWNHRRVFCNPPWTDIASFVKLAPLATIAVFLVPSRPNVGWFHLALNLGARVEYFRGRPKFVHADKPNAGSSPVDCCLLVFEKPL